jgi:hypothetical protein
MTSDPLALMFEKPTLMSFAQNGTRPQGIRSMLRSPALASKRMIGSGSVGVTFQLGAVFGPVDERDREDELDLADVGGEVNATTHRSNIASDECRPNRWVHSRNCTSGSERLENRVRNPERNQRRECSSHFPRTSAGIPSDRL